MIGVNFTSSRIIIFIGYALILPCNTLLVIIFWDTFNRIFSLRKVKQLVSGIDSGQAISSIISYFSIPFIIYFLPSSTYILILSVLSLLGYTYELIYIQNNFEYIEVEKKNQENTNTIPQIAKGNFKKYLNILSIFIILSLFAASFVEYSFLIVITDQFPSEKNLTNFLSFLGGMIVISSFLIQVFLNDLILDNFGLRISLLIVPVIIFVVSIVSIVIEFTLPQDSRLLLFLFIFLSMNHLLVSSLRDALEYPSIKYYFFVLPISIRFTEQNRIDGVVRLTGLAVAGLFMFFLNQFEGLTIVHNSYALVVIAIIWAFVNHKLFIQYQEKLKEGLLLALNRPYKTDHLHQIYIYFLKTVKVQDYLLNIFKNFSYTLLKDTIDDALNFILKDKEIKIQDLQNKTIENLIYSSNRYLRLKSLEKIKKKPNPENLKYLSRLFTDIDPYVKKKVFIVAAELDYEPTLAILAEYFDKTFYTNVVFEAFAIFKNKAIPFLDRIFNTSNDQVILKNIVKLMGYIGTKEAIFWLNEKSNYPNKDVNNKVVSELAILDQKVSVNQKVWAKNKVRNKITDLLWTIYMLSLIEKKKDYEQLAQTVYYESRLHLEQIFNLLKIVYGSQSIDLVKQNYLLNTPDTVSYALELLNIIVENDLKITLLPALDDMSNKDKIRRVATRYGIALFELEKSDNFWRFIFGINHSPITHWIKILALECYLMENLTLPISNSVLGLIQHPKYSIAETAAWVILTIDKPTQDSILSTLPKARQNYLRYRFNLKQRWSFGIPILKIEQVRWLEQLLLFRGFQPYLLLNIAEISKLNHYPNQHILFEQIFHEEYIFILVEGKIKATREDGTDYIIQENNQLLFDIEADKYPQNLVTLEDTWIYEIEKSRLYLLFKHYPDIFDLFLNNLQTFIHTDA